MNPLDQYPGLRKALYLAQWVLNGVTGVLGIVFTAQGETPGWYVVTVAVLAFVWTYAGITAQTNVQQPAGVTMNPIKKDERGVYQWNWATVVIVVLVILIFLIVAGFIDVHH